MRNLRGTYVHRGDAARRRKRLTRTLYAALAVAVVAVVLATRHPDTANAEVASHSSGFSLGLGSGTRELREALDSTKGEMDLLRARLVCRRHHRSERDQARLSSGSKHPLAVADLR